jgi:hypothetical protein
MRRIKIIEIAKNIYEGKEIKRDLVGDIWKSTVSLYLWTINFIRYHYIITKRRLRLKYRYLI